jgi:hypothetical protein
MTYINCSGLTPLIDNRDLVIGAIAGPPKDKISWWTDVMAQVEQTMGRLYRNGVFANLGHEPARIHFGIGFGEWGTVSICYWPWMCD